jgi:ubiquinone/menaquinone biosynthesis C-methylase UbiE
MDYSEQKNFFEIAYRTGSDLWTNKNYQTKILEYLEMIPNDSMTLDVGSGRGKLAFIMAETGLRVIGIDYIPKLAEIGNIEVKAKNLEGRVKFVEGDVFDIPFSDVSFDSVVDLALLQHLRRDDWQKYKNEIDRVLKSGGYVLLVCLSKETEKFFEFLPPESTECDFEKYGMFYHFFTPKELNEIFGENYKVIKQEMLDLQKEKEKFLITLFQKN